MDRGPTLNPQPEATLKTFKCPKTRRFGVKTRGNIAQTTIEFSLICLPFFALLFAIVDYAQIYFYNNALQNALRECCRFTAAGRIIQATDASGNGVYETNSGDVVVAQAISDSGGREASRNECSRWWFLSNCVITVPISNITIVSASVLAGQEPTVITNNGTLTLVSGQSLVTNGSGGSVTISTNTTPAVSGPGHANDYIQITATYTIKTITPLFSYLGGYTRSGWYTYPVRVSAIVKNEPALLNFQHTNIYTDEPGYTATSP
jgi:Flp pilus assembly protein TadG